MNKNRKVILYIAVSLDGYIADENGGVDWLEEAGGEGDNGYKSFFETIDTVVMGKATYNQILGFDVPFPYAEKKCYVFSGTQMGKDEHAEFVNEDVNNFVCRLKQEKGQNIWLVGGAGILDAFMKAGAVDEFILTYIPVILGKGIPLFKNDNPKMKLHLKETKRMNEFVQAHYTV